MLNRHHLAEVLANELNISVQGAYAFPVTLTSVLEHDMVSEFRAKYQLYNLNRKAEAKTVSEQHRKDAWADFQVIQNRVGKFNANFRPTPRMAVAKQIIRDLLPEFCFVEEDVWPLCTFGPGTFHGAVKNALGSSTHYKVGGAQTVTARAKRRALEVILKFFPNWAEHLKTRRLHTLEGNRPSHVPKDVSKCRPISIEPSLNVFLQQGVGRWLGHHMKNVGFADIHHGQAVNRREAACLENGTIDLSNASDTISRELVKYLLPWDWFVVMDSIRSHDYDYRGEKGTYTNFSSQGNAFTFPLETLIFKAIVMAYTGLSKKEVIVYGDDIIVPVQKARLAVYGLERSGFTVNTEKSYYGQHDDERKYFRESCGADWYRGFLVTPIYYRRDAENNSDLAILFNRFVEEWPSCDLTQEYIYSCVKGPVNIGPRYIYSDKPEDLGLWSVSANFGINSIASIYDAYFWNEGLLEGYAVNNRRWMQKSHEISARRFIDERTAELTFLVKGGNFYPPNKSAPGRVRSRRCDYTMADPMVVRSSKVGERLTYVNRSRFGFLNEN